jgi:hypothetical protein
MADTKREQIHDPAADSGVEVPPCAQIAPNAGWLVREKDPRDNGYTGDNAPWRR